MATATYDGHSFLGWFTDPNGGEQVTMLTEEHNGKTLYAHWKEAASSGEPIETVRVTVTADVLNIRSGAGTGYSIVDKAQTGAQMDITAVIANDDRLWGRCSQGWICLEYTNYDLIINGGNGDALYATITASAVNVRSGAGASYSKVAALHKGDVVLIRQMADNAGTKELNRIASSVEEALRVGGESYAVIVAFLLLMIKLALLYLCISHK